MRRAAVQVRPTTTFILARVTLWSLAAVMQWTTQARSMVSRVRNQIWAVAATVERKPYAWDNKGWAVQLQIFLTFLHFILSDVLKPKHTFAPKAPV